MQATVKLFSAAGAEVADLANASAVSWQDVFCEEGTGEFTLPYDDPQVVQIVPGTQVYCYLDGAHVFTWVIKEPPTIAVVDESEESAQQYTTTGSGKAKLLDEARVYSWRGLTPQVMGQHRIYSFASPDYPNTGDWVAATEVAVQSFIDPVRKALVEYTTAATAVLDEDDPENVVEIVAAAAPLGWQIPTAFWIWGQADVYPVGFNYLRGSFTIGIETNLVIAATADNYWTLYLDGVPILGDQGEGIGWQEHKRIDLKLVAGTYNLAAVVENIPLEGLPPIDNPAAFICAVYTVDPEKDSPSAGASSVLTIISFTDSSWIGLPYPATIPGWTPGQILLDAIAEAQARGCLVGFTCGFDGAADSGGNPWVGSSGPGTFVPGYSAPIGSTVFEILTDLVSLGWVDYRFDAALDVLQVWSKGTGSNVTSVVFGADGLDTQNLVSLEYSPHHPVTTAMFVKWSNGFMEVVNDAAVALYGRVEGFLTVDTDQVDEATRQARQALDEVDNIEYAMVAHVDPIDPGVDEPYLNFVPGDFVGASATGEGGGVTVKVFSISVAADEMGRATIVLELNNRLRSLDRDIFDITTALGRGVVGSSKVRNAAATTQTTSAA